MIHQDNPAEKPKDDNLNSRLAKMTTQEPIPPDATPEDEEVDMGAIDLTRQHELVSAAKAVTQRIRNANTTSRPVRLVLVSKLKPATDILALHTHSSSSPTNCHDARNGADGTTPEFRHFGENYVQELQQKARTLPSTIRWHFIGALQSNKCKMLASEVPGLWCVSSVDSAKKANELEKGRAALASRLGEGRAGLERLRVHVQINTSGEESKSGVRPGQEAVELCRHVRDSCPHLKLAGLMAIGDVANSQASSAAQSENEDYVKLREIRGQICRAMEWGEEALELSMGMSDDFESAIGCGSDEVRVGSTIFGARAAKGSRIPQGREER